MILRLFFRIRQRQHMDPQDYFREMREKYGSDLSYSDVNVVYWAVDLSEVSELRKQNILIAHTENGPAIVIREMIGELHVKSEKEALEAAEACTDHVYAEYVHKIRCDRGPA